MKNKTSKGTLYLCGCCPNSLYEHNEYVTAEINLTRAGYNVINPITEMDGYIPKKEIKRSIQLLLESHGIATIDDFSKSRLCRIEIELASLLDMPVKRSIDWLELADKKMIDKNEK